VSRCTDPNMGKLLHAFELDQLDSDLKEQFEVHLLGCENCFEQVSRFENVASLLRSDPDVGKLVSSRAGFEEAGTAPVGSLWARLRRYLWPETNFFLRPVVTYFIVLLLAYPAYLGLRHMDEQPVQGMQSLLLTGTRALSDNRVDAGLPLVVMFRIAGARSGQTYRVIVKAQNGQVIYKNDRFENFNDREMATLLLAAGSLNAGRYRIEVKATDGDSLLHEYTFLVE
jgi:hypothetical protein